MCTTLPLAVLITAKKENQPTAQQQVIGQKIYTYGLFTLGNTIHKKDKCYGGDTPTLL